MVLLLFCRDIWFDRYVLCSIEPNKYLELLFPEEKKYIQRYTIWFYQKKKIYNMDYKRLIYMNIIKLTTSINNDLVIKKQIS